MKNQFTRAAFFDIWDTCLIRTCTFPRDVFRESARRYLKIFPQADEPGIGSEIARQRQAAERDARSKALNNEPSFSEIYQVWDDCNDLNLDLGELSRIELEVEEAFVRPIVSMQRRVEGYRKEGRLIRFISDMYLPGDFLEKLLRTHDFFADGDLLFVSNELRASKRAGDLFSLILDKEKLSPNDCLHIGDNPQGDYDVPRHLGIRSSLFDASRFNRYERRALHLLRTDPDVASRVVGAMRATRLATLLDKDASCEWLAGVAAPLLTFFTADTIRKARERGLKKLYFLSRDGEILWQIARTLPRRPGDPELRYLLSSRRSWGEAALDAADPASFRWLRVFPQRPENLLRKVGFTAGECQEILESVTERTFKTTREYSPAELTPLWNIITAEKWIGIIAKRTAEKRESVLAYLSAEGLTDGQPFGIVDVGWVLNVQASLRRILRAHPGLVPSFEGFYLFCRRERAPQSETGPWHSWFSSFDTACESGTSIAGIVAKYSPVVEELFFKTPTPTLTGFARSESGEFSPIFGPTKQSETEIKYCDRMRSVVLDFARTIGESADHLGSRVDVRHACGALLETFLTDPLPAEARPLVSLGHATDALHESGQARSLVNPYKLADVADVLVQRVTRQKGRSMRELRIWEEASKALTDPFTLGLLHFALVSPRELWTRVRRRERA